jgi:6-hydroxycyclohex-1-ene-1-carbonyl-CoA dehydrogenase
MSHSTLLTTGTRWEMTGVGERLQLREFELPSPGAGEALVQIAGCGVCHTDLGFLYDGVRPRAPLPLALGHEIAGVVAAAGADHAELVGRAVVVPAVLPCGSCAACRAGFAAVCARQIMPGNDAHGGFASHVLVPARGLCPVPGYDAALPGAPLARSGVDLAGLSVLADAVTTPYQSIERARVKRDDLVCVVGLGGVGGFAAQIAAAHGARVVGFDVSQERLALLSQHGVELALDPRGASPKELRDEVRAFAKREGLPVFGWKIFECSGHQAGQELAFGLLGPAAYLGVVGYTLAKIEVRLSNLMAFDAKVVGNWGCVPEHYPAALALVLEGRVAVRPFVERYPMDSVQAVLEAVRARRVFRRPVLVNAGPVNPVPEPAS